MKNSRSKNLLTSVATIAALSAASSAFASTIAQWSFENQSVTTPPTINNNPTPSAGSGTASSIGMDGYATPNPGVTSDDVLVGLTADTGTNGIADTGQIWRIRAQAATTGGPAANGWSSTAPIGTQGAVFGASTADFSDVNVSFDWYATNKGEGNLQLEYTTDGTTWNNVAVAIPAADTNVTLLTNSASANTVKGSYLQMSGGQQWEPGLTATITDPAAANNPLFAVEMVNASTGADDISASGAALNNTSGNWRFDNVSINGTATPEPASLGVLALGGMALLARRRK